MNYTSQIVVSGADSAFIGNFTAGLINITIDNAIVTWNCTSPPDTLVVSEAGSSCGQVNCTAPSPAPSPAPAPAPAPSPSGGGAAGNQTTNGTSVQQIDSLIKQMFPDMPDILDGFPGSFPSNLNFTMPWGGGGV